MRAFAYRRLALAVVGLAVVLSGRAFAQSTPPAADNRLEAAAVDALVSKATEAEEKPDEVTVEGRRGEQLGKYRVEMQRARDKFVDVFNKVNSKDDTDVKCRTEKPTGTRMGHSVCRSRAENAADASAAKGMLDSLLLSAGLFTSPRGPNGGPTLGGGAQVNAAIGTSKSRQSGASAEEVARAELEAEMKKMIADNRELYRAVVKYVEARNDYNEARGQGSVIAVQQLE